MLHQDTAAIKGWDVRHSTDGWLQGELIGPEGVVAMRGDLEDVLGTYKIITGERHSIEVEMRTSPRAARVKRIENLCGRAVSVIGDRTRQMSRYGEFSISDCEWLVGVIKTLAEAALDDSRTAPVDQATPLREQAGGAQ